MDVYCPKCGEPFDADEWHDWNDRSYEQNRDAFFAEGCEAMGLSHNRVANSSAVVFQDALRDLMGDDIDGIAGGMEDARRGGLL